MSPRKPSNLRRALSGISDAFRTEIQRRFRADAWINYITGLGGSRDRSTRADVALVCPIDPQVLEEMYHGTDLAAHIVDKITKEALRQGFTISGDEDGERARACRKWGVRHKVQEAAIWGRLYGGGIILLGSRKGRMDQPLDVERMGPGDLLYLMVLDRRDLAAVDYYTNPVEPKFGEPRTYQVTASGAHGTVATQTGALVHESRLIVFGGAHTSARMKQRNGGWDLSVLQRPYEVLRDMDQMWRSVMNLVQDLSQAVFKVQGLIDAIAEGEKDVILQRMEVVDLARSVARAVVVDAENESFEHTGAANITGVDPLLMRTFQRVATAADMPVTVLLGVSPAGLNATGESDTRHWYDRVQSHREDDLSPALEKLVQIVCRTEGVALPDDEDVEIEWPSLWQMTPREELEIEKMQAETDKIRIDSQVLLPEEVTLVRFSEGPFSEVVDLDLREQRLEEAAEEPEAPSPGTPGAPPDPNAPPGAPAPEVPPEAPQEPEEEE